MPTTIQEKEIYIAKVPRLPFVFTPLPYKSPFPDIGDTYFYHTRRIYPPGFCGYPNYQTYGFYNGSMYADKEIEPQQ
jgi:hypothetical protein